MSLRPDSYPSLRMLWSSAVVLSFLHLCLSKPLARRWDDLVEKHSWADIPKGWDFDSPAPANYVFDLRIGVKQAGREDLIANLMEISDPGHGR